MLCEDCHAAEENFVAEVLRRRQETQRETSFFSGFVSKFHIPGLADIIH